MPACLFIPANIDCRIEVDRRELFVLSENSNHRRLVLLIRFAGILAVGLTVVVASGLLWMGLSEGFSVAYVEETIISWGGWGVAGSIGLMVIHSFVPFPAEFVAFANGMIYGPFWGTVITWTGAMLGAFVAFGLSRLLGRPFVEAMIAQKNWQMVDRWTEQQGWQILLVSRFLPVIAFNLVNYGAGLTRVSWWTFTWTTGLGILPLTTLMVMMGDHLDSIGWQAWVLMLAGGVALWLLVRLRFRLIPARQRDESG